MNSNHFNNRHRRRRHFVQALLGSSQESASFLETTPNNASIDNRNNNTHGQLLSAEMIPSTISADFYTTESTSVAIPTQPQQTSCRTREGNSKRNNKGHRRNNHNSQIRSHTHTPGEQEISRVLGVWEQACNFLVRATIGESLVHLMLCFALLQDVTRQLSYIDNINPDTTATETVKTLLRWVIFGQTCTVLAWALQLKYLHKTRNHKHNHRNIESDENSESGDASCSSRTAATLETTNNTSQVAATAIWRAARRECFWGFSLIVSALELFVYINSKQLFRSSDSSGGMLAVIFESSMLRMLISIRLILVLVLVVISVYRRWALRRCHSRRRFCNQCRHHRHSHHHGCSSCLSTALAGNSSSGAAFSSTIVASTAGHRGSETLSTTNPVLSGINNCSKDDSTCNGNNCDNYNHGRKEERERRGIVDWFRLLSSSSSQQSAVETTQHNTLERRQKQHKNKQQQQQQQPHYQQDTHSFSITGCESSETINSSGCADNFFPPASTTAPPDLSTSTLQQFALSSTSSSHASALLIPQPNTCSSTTNMESGAIYGSAVSGTGDHHHYASSSHMCIASPAKFSTETTPLISTAGCSSPVFSPQSFSELSPTPEQDEEESDTHDGKYKATGIGSNNDGDGDGGSSDGEDHEADSNALRSGVKKVRMYHQSDELQHDIDGLRKRMGLLLPFLWPFGNRALQLRILCCMLILAAGRIVNVLVPLQFKIVVDGLTAQNGGSVKFEWGHILLYGALQSMQGSVGILSTIQSFVWIPVGQYATKRISVAMFEHLHKLSLRFHIGRKTGEILRVQDRGVTSIVSLLSSLLFNIIPTLVDIVLACYFFSVMFDLYFGTIVLVTMSSYLIVTVSLTGWRTRYRRQANYLDNEMEARAVDSLLNFETVKYYNAEKFECNEYSRTVDDFQVAEWKSNAAMNMLNTAQNTVIQLGLLACALLSAKRVSDGRMTVGDFTMLLSYITQLYGPLNWFGTYYRVIQKNFVDMEKLLELLDEPIEIKDIEPVQRFEVPRGEVVFENVSFSYDTQPTLSNVSFRVPAGSTVAIVGPSGSGKSTILRLLFRFYDVHSGHILIDGQDIRSIPQASLRQTIGIVPQDTVLFNDSIRYNVAYGKAGACGDSDRTVTMHEVVAAADAAQVHDRIMSFSDGYETRVGERGQRLSGGEKQRVAIARTLLKDPKIVCLDEATSALDTATERQIQSSLSEMTKNRTTLIIAHRLSTIVHADQILIVKDGRIFERGTHAELIADKDSLYYDMWMKQLTDTTSSSSSLLDSGYDLQATGGDSARSSGQSSPLAMLSTQPHPSIQQSLAEPIMGSNGMESTMNHHLRRHHRIRQMRLEFDEGALPHSMLTQGWLAHGPQTVPLPGTAATILGANGLLAPSDMYQLDTASGSSIYSAMIQTHSTSSDENTECRVSMNENDEDSS